MLFVSVSVFMVYIDNPGLARITPVLAHTSISVTDEIYMKKDKNKEGHKSFNMNLVLHVVAGFRGHLLFDSRFVLVLKANFITLLDQVQFIFIGIETRSKWNVFRCEYKPLLFCIIGKMGTSNKKKGIYVLFGSQ